MPAPKIPDPIVNTLLTYTDSGAIGCIYYQLDITLGTGQEFTDQIIVLPDTLTPVEVQTAIQNWANDYQSGYLANNPQQQ